MPPVYKKREIVICLPTEHLLKRVSAFQIELEFGTEGFSGEGKNGVHGEKPLGYSTHHMASTPGF